MEQVNMLEAKTNLSKLVEAIDSGQTREIIIARSGRPVARLVPLDRTIDTSQRIGVAKSLFKQNQHKTGNHDVNPPFQNTDDALATMFDAIENATQPKKS